MGFYGNITNVSRTQFQFDKIYPNRVEMERAKLTDSIYLGRHVLIEYDSNYHRDSYLRVWFDKEGDPAIAYTSDKYESDTSLKNSDAEENPIVVVYGEKEDKFYAWQKPEEYDSEKDGSKIAKYDEIVSGNDLLYTINYAIDLNAYKAARGYDSTVWQKVYSEGSERYVMIAELNTVVPTFEVSADAPTMSPITPHFDTRSTDVYYKLHWQAPWGFRIAAAEKGNTTNNESDLMTSWERESYNPNTGATTKEYYFSDEQRWRALNSGESIPKLNAAIYFNQAGFNEYSPSYIDGINLDTNQIKITPSGKSGQNYNKHDGSIDVEPKIDTQEMIINLPAIGNMMSNAWDIIHGDDRKDSTGDEHPSLQGRLNAFSAMKDNTIAIKRSEDGTLVGTQINGNTNRMVDNILNETLDIDNFAKDDAWIKVNINTVGLDNDTDLQGISIHHTFHPVAENTKSDSNKNTDQVASDLNSDKIDLYTPIVDAAGHVVGKNTETVTLPYGFKTIKTNGRDSEVSENATGTPTTADVVADNTQDVLTINSGNKWIRIDTDANNDTVTIRHDVHDTSDTEDTTDWTETEANTTIPTVTYEYDEAGHYVSHHTENYKLPFGYGKIVGDSGNTAATATYDELIFTSDEWLTAKVTEDTVTYNHDEPNPNEIVYTDKENQYPSFGSAFTIEDWAFDEKGHQFNDKKYHTVTIPGIVLNNAKDGNVVVGLTLSKAIEDNNKTATFTESKVNVGNLALTDYSVVSHTNANGTTDLQPQDTINEAFNKLQTQIYEEEVARANETSRAQGAEKALSERIDALDYSETADSTKIITQITQIDGKITEIARAAAGTLILGAASNSGMIKDTDSLNTAFNTVETAINDEKTRAKEAEQNLNSRIDVLLGEGNISETFDTIKEIADWLDTEGNGAKKIIDDIATLNGNVDVEGSVDYKIETQVLDKLGSAAWSNITDYATAAQGEKADSAVQPETPFIYNEEQKTIAELFSIVAELSATVTQLQNDLNALKEKVETEHPTPIEPEVPAEPEVPEIEE